LTNKQTNTNTNKHTHPQTDTPETCHLRCTTNKIQENERHDNIPHHSVSVPTR